MVNNFRAGVMERMGLGYDALHADLSAPDLRRRHRLTARSGPYAHKGGQDILAQALSGVMARKCDPTDPLTIYPTSLADYSAGMHLVQGILLALMQRERTGKGQMVSVSLYDSMLAMQMQEAAMAMMRGVDFSWGALPHNGAFATTDGALVVVGAFKENPLREISLAIGLDDLSADPRFCTFELSMQNRTALHDVLRAHFATNTHGALDRRAGGARPAVRAGAQPGGGAGRSADRDQRHEAAPAAGQRRRAARGRLAGASVG